MFISQKLKDKFLKWLKGNQKKLLKTTAQRKQQEDSQENEGQIIIEYDRLLHLSSTCSGG